MRDIQKQAKKIMDNFVKALEKVKVQETKVERDVDRRDEGGGGERDSDFRKIMFKNAPDVKDDCIVGEKGGWV